MKWMARGGKQGTTKGCNSTRRKDKGWFWLTLHMHAAGARALLCSALRLAHRGSETRRHHSLFCLSLTSMSLFLTMDATGLQFVAAATSIYPRHPRIHRIRPGHNIPSGPWQPASLLLILKISSPGDDLVSAYTSTGNGPRLSRSGEPHSPWR